MTVEEAHCNGAYLPTLVNYCGVIVLQGCSISHFVTDKMKQEAMAMQDRSPYYVQDCKKRNQWEEKGYSDAFDEIVLQTHQAVKPRRFAEEEGKRRYGLATLSESQQGILQEESFMTD
jgi:hypothetical protein